MFRAGLQLRAIAAGGQVQERGHLPHSFAKQKTYNNQNDAKMRCEKENEISSCSIIFPILSTMDYSSEKKQSRIAMRSNNNPPQTYCT